MLKSLKLNIILITAFAFIAQAANALPSYKEVRASYAKSDTMLVDRNGVPLYELRTNKSARRLEWTRVADMSPALLLAVIIAEDKRFFEHSGVDYLSIGAAITGGTEEKMRGASTITMQLASALDPELRPQKGRRTVLQKTQQILDARELEKSWSKREILEAYLNLIYFRGELQGIAAASHGLFGKAPHGLNHGESLVLASLIRSPNAGSDDLARRVSLLQKALGWPVQENEIKATASGVASGHMEKMPGADLAPHAARLLIKKPSEAKKVTCSIDSAIQRFAVERLRHHLNILSPQNVANGAVLVADNKTGQVLAYASCTTDPSLGWYVDGVQAKRQAGSTLKPFLYALAFEKRILTPASVLDDAPLDVQVSSGIYSPHNYDSNFKGLVTARTALASSLNIPAVRTVTMTGIEAFLAKLRRLGIKGLSESGDYYGPSAALGSIDVSLWELTNAYRCMANGGMHSELTFYLNKAKHPKTVRAYSAEAAFLVSDILSDREARSATFGLENPLATRFRSSVKTGTSKDMRDNWCVGYSQKYTVGVWVGNFTGEAMRDVSGISGAAPVWAEVMARLHRNEKNRKPAQPPPDIVRREVSPFAGEPLRAEWFIQGTEPDDKYRETGQLNQKIIYPPSGAILALDPDIPPELQKVFFVSQPQKSGSRWHLNDMPVEVAGNSADGKHGAACWVPAPGYYTLTLSDENGSVADSVRFEVRGPVDRKQDDY
ncbi:MAG: penicillin-binding protein 1C [Spirochaetota bacterium]